MSQLKQNHPASVESLDSNWNHLYKIGGIAALIMAAIIPIQSFIFVVFPPPKTVIDFFNLFQRNPILGLLDLDLLLIIENLLLILVFLSLYAALKKINKSLMTVALAFGIVGIVLLLVSREATFSMLTLSNQYANASSEAQRIMYVTIGQTMLTTYNGGVFDTSYVIGAIPLLLIPLVMFKSNDFRKSTAIIIGISGFLMLVPPTVGMTGLLLSFLSLIPTLIWLIIVALKLFQLANQEHNNKTEY